MKNAEHEHNYVPEKIVHQVRSKEYLTDGKYDLVTLDQQQIIIFCTKCGDSKEIPLVTTKEK